MGWGLSPPHIFTNELAYRIGVHRSGAEWLAQL